MADYRSCCVAGSFYPSDPSACAAAVDRYSSYDFDSADPAIGGIVPHAGWMYSGATAGKVFAAIKKTAAPSTFVVFGAAHRHRGPEPAILMSGAWETPLGDIRIDERAAAAIAKAFPGIETRPGAHDDEHSIEVQAPFIKRLFPEAEIAPIIVPPGDNCAEFGAAVAKALEGSGAVFIGSADLTHYGHEFGFAPKGAGGAALEWVKETNDRRFVELATGMKAGELVGESRRNRNSCGAGAAAAAVAAAGAMGAERGRLLEYTTSHDVMKRGVPSMFVGYAGIVYQ